jgi:hypothetical protein
MWTRFMDMHSGGGQKEKWQYIYIEAPECEAKVIFYNRFDHNPERVTCTCCGEDYSISSDESLTQLTAYERGCAYGSGGYIEERRDSWVGHVPLEDYIKSDEAMFVFEKDILNNERIGYVPEQGYVWVE